MPKKPGSSLYTAAVTINRICATYSMRSWHAKDGREDSKIVGRGVPLKIRAPLKRRSRRELWEVEESTPALCRA